MTFSDVLETESSNTRSDKITGSHDKQYLKALQWQQARCASINSYNDATRGKQNKLSLRTHLTFN